MDNTKEYILCAAWKRKYPRPIGNNPKLYDKNSILDIEIGYRHHDIYCRFGNDLIPNDNAMGFYTSKGRYVSRTTAAKIAYKAGQITKKQAIWSEEELKDTIDGLELQNVKPGHFKPLFSEDLY